MSNNDLSYARPVNVLEATNYENRRTFLGLPRDLEALGEKTTRRVVGGLPAIKKAAMNGCLTQDALASLEANQRSWRSLFLVPTPTASVKRADTARVELLDRQIKTLTEKLTDGAQRLHWDDGGKDLIFEVADLSRRVLRALEGRSKNGTSADNMIDVGLAQPGSVTLLAASVTALAGPASVFLQQVSAWRDRHAGDFFTWNSKKATSGAAAVLQPLIHLCHHLSASSVADEVVRSLVPNDVGEHDILRLVQAYEYVKSKHPEIELSKISQALSRLLTELEPCGSDLAKTRFIMVQWGHLLPREALLNPTPYALLASALEAVACATSTGEVQRDPFTRLLGPRATARDAEVVSVPQGLPMACVDSLPAPASAEPQALLPPS